MKEKNRQRIGKVLLAVVVLLIVVIFSIWYIAGLTQQQEENVVEPPKQEQQEQQPVQQQPTPSIQNLTVEELDKISDQLNTAKDNPLIAILYQNPTEIKVSQVPYNGAVGTTTISSTEKMQVSEKIRKKQLDSKNPFSESQAQAYLHNSILKLKRTEMEAYLKQKTGIEIQIQKDVDELGIYLEETDSYYQARTSTNFIPIFCDNGTFDPSTGIYAVEYHRLVAETEAEKYVVQMRMQDGEFVFVSNQEKK